MANTDSAFYSDILQSAKAEAIKNGALHGDWEKWMAQSANTLSKCGFRNPAEARGRPIRSVHRQMKFGQPKNKKEKKMTSEITNLSPVLAAYEAETSIDQTIPIRRRLEALGGIVATDGNVDEAKEARKQLNALLKDAAAPRMRVQRAIKTHPIGKWAFTKSELEKDIEAKAEHLKLEIDAHTKSAETLSLASDRRDWLLVIRGVDLATMNRLVADLLDRHILAENRGPCDYEEKEVK